MAGCLDGCVAGAVFVIRRFFLPIWSTFGFTNRKLTDTKQDELEMDSVLAEVNRVQEILKDDRIQLNNHLWRHLARKLAKMKIALEACNRSTLATDNQRNASRELLFVLKRVEDLVHKCIWQDFLDGATTMGNFKEEVAELHLDLSWWTSMVKFAALHGPMLQGEARGKEAQHTVAKAKQKHETLLKKLSKGGSETLRRAWNEDKKNLLHKLAEIRDRYKTVATSFTRKSVGPPLEYVLAVYLHWKIKQDDDNIPEEVATQLEQFIRGDFIGRGGLAIVWEVTWLNRKCALKESEVVDMKEGLILRRCNHPHIVEFLWYWEKSSRQSCLLMERMPKNLKVHIDDELRRRYPEGGGAPFELHVAIDIMLQVAKAMRYLYNMKIVHRDLKPANILVQPCETSQQDGYVRIKLADFGIAKGYNHTATASAQTPNQGTTIYAAPEAFGHRAYGEHLSFPPMGDIWSFALTCSQILTGQEPFKNEVKVGLHARIVKGLRPPLPEDCPEYLRTLIKCCWDINPENRPTFVDIYRMLKIAKAVSLGVMHFDVCKHLLPYKTRDLPDPYCPITTRLNDIATPSRLGPNEKYCEKKNEQYLQEIGQSYILIGTSFRYYTNASMSEEMCDQYDTYMTGIKGEGLKNKNVIKQLSPFEAVIMEGSCWTKPAEKFAYGCLTGVFLNAKHANKLKANNIGAVEGGFIAETDTRSIAPEIKKFAWGSEDTWSHKCVTVGSFYSKSEDTARYVYVNMSYNATEHALISHLWHGEDLVLGDPSTADMSSENVQVVGSQIMEVFHGTKLTTFSIATLN